MLYEKYRPKTLDEIVGQDHIVNAVRIAIQKEKAGIQPFPHMAFAGPPGCGKTTMARVIASELGLPITEINASDERRLADVREKIKPMSRFAARQIIYLGEADNIDSDAQQALRRVIETAPATTFLMSLNREWKIIDPIKSRFVFFRFRPLTNLEVAKYILNILQKENITLKEEDREVFMGMIKSCRGDLRKALTILESSITPDRQLSPFAMEAYKTIDFAPSALSKAVSGDFEQAQKLLEEAYITAHFDPNQIIESLYQSIPELPLPNEHKIKLYSELGLTEANLKLGTNPLVQLTSFLAKAWLIPHLPTNCPVKSRVSSP